MQAESSQAPHAGLTATGVVSVPLPRSHLLTLAAAAQQVSSHLLLSQLSSILPTKHSLSTSSSTSSRLSPHSLTQAAHTSHAQDPTNSSQNAVYRVPAVPRTAPLVDYSNPYPQLDSHAQLHSHPFGALQSPPPLRIHLLLGIGWSSAPSLALHPSCPLTHTLTPTWP